MTISRSTLYASGAALVLVVVAVLGGLYAARSRTPAATPSPVPTAAAVLPLPTELPDTSALLFRQPLAAGCATATAVYVFSDGGGIGRFDGQRWSLIDPTLRSLVAASCAGDSALAVGPAGRLVTIDETARTIRADTISLEDLAAVAPLPDGALAVGSRGTVLREAAAWQPYARGIEEDLFGVAGLSGTSAWIVGAGGVSYRLDGQGWKPVATGVTVTLRALAATSVDDVIAVGDAGTVLVFARDAWQRLDVGTDRALHGIARIGRSFIAIVGDAGTVVRLSETGTSRLDLRTTCDLRSVFARGAEYWIVGSSGDRAGVWRVAGDRLDRWGSC